MTDLTLECLGWSNWFAAQAGAGCAAGTVPARVAAVDRGQMLVLNQHGSRPAKLSGRYQHQARSAADHPCVGDWVCVDDSHDAGVSLVHQRLPRRTSLYRKAAGNPVERQMIAANVDVVIIVQSCHFDFNLKRLERYLVMVRAGGSKPYIVLTKADLVQAEILADQIRQIRDAGITEPVTSLSNVTQQGCDELEQLFAPGMTYCFVGSSGVGKSTLINHLLGKQAQATGLVSGTGEGRHTTVRRELLRLNNGALVIDNPGMREFGVLGADDGLEASYTDIAQLAEGCRFRDCTHNNEPGCAVLQALHKGEITSQHYDNFIKLRRESAHHQMSYAQKRRKDRAFGRYLKGVKQDLANR